jgi:polyisoprenoid-binding protein YceI
MTTAVLTTITALSAIGITLSAASGVASRADARIPVAAALGGPPDSLVVDPRASTIRWKGVGFGSRDSSAGTVNVESGLIVIRHEKLTSGVFTIDMRSVAMAGAPTILPASWRAGERIRVAELFKVVRHPRAVFRSTGATRIAPARWRVSGDLTMNDVTRPITFDADVAWPETGHMVATSMFTIDRAEWRVATASSGRVTAAGDGAIQLAITLDARRKQPKVVTR